jgi:predicted ArsR family transcriptional regulator
MDLPYFPSDTKRELLFLMKRRGKISLDDAQASTGLTRTTLREHLGQLGRDGLVERSARRQGRGRPPLLYALTAAGERLFPSRDHVLLGALLEYLKATDNEWLVNGFFERYWANRLREVEFQLSKIASDEPDARVRAVEELLEEQGFMPDIRREERGLVIRECNCPFAEAVKHTRLPCQLEAEFFEKVFDDRIGRVAYIPDGSPACTYEFPNGASE